jgi:putative FmdB family regulatory protein
MPIYEYQCQKCGVFEEAQKITDKPLGRCPTCKGKVKRLISNTSFHLKGSGWYLTDYARKEKAPKEKKEEKAPVAEAKGDGKAGAGSDSEKKPSTDNKPSKTASSEPTSP